MHGASIHTSQFSVPDCLVPVSSTPFPLSICMFVCFWMPAVMDVDRTLVIVHSACRFSVLMTPLACPGWPNFHSSACVFPSFSHPPNRAELSTIAISRLLDLIEISGDGWSLEGVPVFGCPGISIVLLPGSPIPANIHILCIVLSLPLLDRCLTSVPKLAQYLLLASTTTTGTRRNLHCIDPGSRVSLKRDASTAQQRLSCPTLLS